MVCATKLKTPVTASLIYSVFIKNTVISYYLHSRYFLTSSFILKVSMLCYFKYHSYYRASLPTRVATAKTQEQQQMLLTHLLRCRRTECVLSWHTWSTCLWGQWEWRSRSTQDRSMYRYSSARWRTTSAMLPWLWPRYAYLCTVCVLSCVQSCVPSVYSLVYNSVICSSFPTRLKKVSQPSFYHFRVSTFLCG